MTLYAYKTHQPKLHPTVYVAPTAQIIGNVHIGKHASIWFQTVIRGDLDKIRIGAMTNIQDLCMCHVDKNIPLNIGNRVTIGHRAVIHGCTIEDDCLIGMGAIVMNQAVIGKGSVVAAGAVVLEKTSIPPYSLVTGSPGKVKKTYENLGELKQKMSIMSESYVDSARNFGSSEIFYRIED
ncbi:gamma carbonic anhydrase family protein [Desulfobacula sp.]|uniref:gamma carbonic anhydrase family protein n=1 Tax=Desulfobacula sp. TaxID=2593537 RepID=UPI002612101B|nr:gamma carbonic anhydrase family protein [Desulfobacula sp.]